MTTSPFIRWKTDNIYISPDTEIANDLNTGVSMSSPKLTLASALSLIDNPCDSNVTIHIASGVHAWPLVNSSEIYMDKVFINSSLLRIKGYINPTPNQFIDVASYSGISSGGNQSLFPCDTVPSENYTYLNVSGSPWTTNQWGNCFLQITGGKGYISPSSPILDYYSNWYLITSNTASRLTLLGRYNGDTPDNTTTFKIYDSANMPLISGTGATKGIQIVRANSILFQFLKIGAPDTGTPQSIVADDSINVNFLMNYINGGNAVFTNTSIGYNKNVVNVSSSLDTGLIHNTGCIASLTGNFITGYKRRGVTCSKSSLTGDNNWISSANTGATDDGTTIAGLWVDVGGNAQIELSRIQGLNVSTVANYAVFVESGSTLTIRSYTHLKGQVATSNTYGLFGCLNAKIGESLPYVLIDGFWMGAKMATNAAWSVGSAPTYTNCTINSYIEPKAVKTTNIYDVIPRLIDPGANSYADDDFTSGGTTTGIIGKLGWNFSVAGTGGISTVADESGRPGIVRIATGTTNASVALLYLYSSGTGGLLPSDFFDLLFYCRLNTNDANTTVRIGLQNAAGGNPPNNGIYFEKLDADTSWFGVTRAASSTTRTAAIAACSTNWVKLRIRRIDVNTIGFTIDNGTEVTATATIPTVALCSELYIINSTTASKTLDIDMFSLLITGLSR